MLGSESVRPNDDAWTPVLLLMMNRETPPSIDDDVPWARPPGVFASVVVEEDRGRRKPSWPAILVNDAFREIVSTGAGFTVADIEDIAGGALAECDGLNKRAVMSVV